MVTRLPAADAASLRMLMISSLPHSMAEHIDRVVVLAGELARKHGLDERRTLLAAQAHDLLRAVPEPALLADAEARGLELEDVEREHPVLLHGPLGALALAERGGVADAAILDAVRHHTTGHPDYTREAWAMFIADKVEPHKLERWPALHAIIELAQDSLEAAALAYLELRRVQSAHEGEAEPSLATATRKSLHRRAALA